LALILGEMRNVRLPSANGTISRWHRHHGKQCSVIYHTSKARLPPEGAGLGYSPGCVPSFDTPRATCARIPSGRISAAVLGAFHKTQALLAPAVAAEAGRHSARTPAALRLSRVRGLLTRFGRRDRGKRRGTRRVEGLVRHWPRDVVGSGPAPRGPPPHPPTPRTPIIAAPPSGSLQQLRRGYAERLGDLPQRAQPCHGGRGSLPLRPARVHDIRGQVKANSIPAPATTWTEDAVPNARAALHASRLDPSSSFNC
jgi:hypothetical protein